MKVLGKFVREREVITSRLSAMDPLATMNNACNNSNSNLFGAIIIEVGASEVVFLGIKLQHL